MTIENQIAALLAQAEPLRLLPDAEGESMGLPGVVEQINALRAEQTNTAKAVFDAPEIDPQAPSADELGDALPLRRPGRPKKVG